jgi:PadR family transcriptional regulator, regulatory protein PadR
MKIAKDLVAASATTLVLGILADGESYGYALLRRVGELSGGSLQWTDGMLYPLLHRLERLGYIESSWGVSDSGRRRKYYCITSGGLAELKAQRTQWETVDNTLRNLWNQMSFVRRQTVFPRLRRVRIKLAPVPAISTYQ